MVVEHLIHIQNVYHQLTRGVIFVIVYNCDNMASSLPESPNRSGVSPWLAERLRRETQEGMLGLGSSSLEM